MNRSLIFLLSSFLTFSGSLKAEINSEIAQYKSPEILARANINDGFKLPPMTFLSNTTPVINNQGDVAFKLMSIGGENQQGIWLKNILNPDGAIVYTAPDLRLITDPSLNENGVVAFNLFDDGVTDGIFSYDGSTNQTTQVLKPTDSEISFYTYPQITTGGQIYFRGTNEENIRTFYQADKKLSSVIKEGEYSFGQKTSYLFKPSINDLGELSFKRRIGDIGEWDESAGDEILLLRPNGKKFDYLSIARDRDLDSNSPFLGFYNTTGISKNGMVTFTASLLDSRKAIVLWRDGVLYTLASEGDNNISEIEMFAPKINNQGIVLFRALDNKGARGLYLANQKGIERIIGEGDEVMTDIGPGKILSNPNYPGFGGEVDINDQGEIVFYCLLVGAKDDKELGSAVYKISPENFPENIAENN